MRPANDSFTAVFEDKPIYMMCVVAFAVLLTAALVYLLVKKLRSFKNNNIELETTSEALAQQVNTISKQPEEAISGATFSNYNSAQTPQRQPLPDAMPRTEVAAATTDNTEINSILNSLTDIIFEFNEQKVIVNVWYNNSRNFTVDLDAFKGKTIAQNVGLEKSIELDKALDDVMRNRQSASLEFPSLFGTSKWFSAKISPVFDKNGSYTGHVTASVSDISEQKKYSIALKENQAQLLDAQRIARIGNWWFDLETKETYWSDNLFSLLEISALPPDTSYFEFYAKMVHPEDRRHVYHFFSDMATNPLRQTEHRILTAAGNYRYFRVMRGEPTRDASGNITRVSGIIKDVTETRLAERTVKKSQAELLEAQTIAKIGNWKWYFDQKTLKWSDEVYHIHEVKPVQQQQRGINHFKILLRYVHPEDRNILLSFLRDPTNRQMVSYEYRIITPNGNIKYLSIIIGKVKRNDDGSVRNVIGTLQDITVRKKAELNIQRTEDSYQSVLEGIKLAALSLDHEGNITFCNKYLAKMLDYPQSSLIGLNWYQQFIPQNLKDVFKGWYDRNSVESTYINPVVCRNGEQRIISWQNTTIYDEYGRIKQTTSIGEDITDVQKDREKLISAKEQAERSSLFKSEFLSTMSHEIRTPMNAVIGTTNLLLAEDPRPDQLTYLNNLKFSGENLLSIIDDILDYNKIEAGKLELVNLPLNIHQLIANIRQSFYARATEKNLELIAEVDATIPQIIKADATRLSQILNNLVSNAIKFTQKGKIVITVKELSRTGGRINIKFMVTDTGIGIESASLQKIFDPFVQATASPDHGGSGLGLAIVKRLVELHNTTITAASKPGFGTQFRFNIEFDYIADLPVVPAQSPKLALVPLIEQRPALPANTKISASPVAIDTNKNSNVAVRDHYTAVNNNAAPQVPPVKKAYQEQIPSAPHLNKNLDPALKALQNVDLSGMRVLIVDDNKMNILIANRFLNKWNVKTHEANNGINAIEMVAANKYDLVIMDLQMPIMDGFEATKAIKKTNPDLPIIALTADAMPETFSKARNSGMDDYMTKPFMPDILYNKVSKYYRN